MKKSISVLPREEQKKRSMANRMQKKLEELECDLGELIHHPIETKVAFLFEAIQRRFIFLKNLLSAEMETHSNNPQYLQDIALRMALLERAFLEWVELTKTPDPDFDTHSSPNPDINIHSLCSCPKSPISEDEEQEEPSFPVEQAKDEEASVYHVQQDILPVIAVVEGEREGQKKKVVFGKKSRIVAVVVAAWAAWIATASFSVTGYYEERDFLTPT